MLWVGLRCVFVLFPDHTHLLLGQNKLSCLKCSVSLPRVTVGWSVICDITWSYSLAFRISFKTLKKACIKLTIIQLPFTCI